MALCQIDRQMDPLPFAGSGGRTEIENRLYECHDLNFIENRIKFRYG